MWIISLGAGLFSSNAPARGQPGAILLFGPRYAGELAHPPSCPVDFRRLRIAGAQQVHCQSNALSGVWGDQVYLSSAGGTYWRERSWAQVFSS